MIVSPRAEEIIDVLRKEGNGFIKINKVLLYKRTSPGSPYRKIVYWVRGEDSNNPPSLPLQSFAIVPEMTAAAHKGFGVSGNTNAANTWKAFDRNM